VLLHALLIAAMRKLHDSALRGAWSVARFHHCSAVEPRRGFAGNGAWSRFAAEGLSPKK